MYDHVHVVLIVSEATPDLLPMHAVFRCAVLRCQAPNCISLLLIIQESGRPGAIGKEEEDHDGYYDGGCTLYIETQFLRIKRNG